jgi:hypothetical protein
MKTVHAVKSITVTPQQQYQRLYAADWRGMMQSYEVK